MITISLIVMVPKSMPVNLIEILYSNKLLNNITFVVIGSDRLKPLEIHVIDSL